MENSSTAKVLGVPLDEVRRRTGSIAQVARIDSFVELEGEPRGARRLRMVNGGGVEIDVYPDRGLDLGQVTFEGIPVAWMEAAGISAPAFYNFTGSEWLRIFGGGLLTTCGLDTFGPPSRDGGKDFGQHGRISAAPARMIATSSEGDALVVEAVMRQSVLFGENLTLRRRISSEIGSNRFVVEDVVTNEAFVESPHMILYHVNLGWPLVEEGGALTIPSRIVEPRDEVSARGLARMNVIGPPSADAQDEVFLHRFDGNGLNEVELNNPRVGLGLMMRFDSAQLPFMYQWNKFSEGSYVLGLEPANCAGILGREQARADGRLPILRAGESVSYKIEFEFRRFDRGDGS
jgi:hypothetical protein